MGLSRRFVLNLIHKTYLHTTNIMELAALSIYLASCLKELPMTCGPIASATGVSEDDIRAIRARFYPHREELLEYRHYEAMRRTDSTERTLGFLAPEVPSPV